MTGSVAAPAMTSTSGMTGAGLKKWRPRTRSGCALAAIAIAVTDSALVLVARIVVAGSAASSCRKIARLASRSSSAASTTRSGHRFRERDQRRGVAQPGEATLDPTRRPTPDRGQDGQPGARDRSGSATVRARWRRGPRRGDGPRGRPRWRAGRSLRPSCRHRRHRRPRPSRRPRPWSDRLDRFERLAAVGAVADGAALRRAEDVLEGRPARAAIRARNARLEVDQASEAEASRVPARWRDPGSEQGLAPGRADPLGGPRDLEGRLDLDRPPEDGEALARSSA